MVVRPHEMHRGQPCCMQGAARARRSADGRRRSRTRARQALRAEGRCGNEMEVSMRATTRERCVRPRGAPRGERLGEEDMRSCWSAHHHGVAPPMPRNTPPAARSACRAAVASDARVACCAARLARRPPRAWARQPRHARTPAPDRRSESAGLSVTPAALIGDAVTCPRSYRPPPGRAGAADRGSPRTSPSSRARSPRGRSSPCRGRRSGWCRAGASASPGRR